VKSLRVYPVLHFSTDAVEPARSVSLARLISAYGYEQKPSTQLAI